MVIRHLKAEDQAVFLTFCKDFYSGGAVLHEVDPDNFRRTFYYGVAIETVVLRWQENLYLIARYVEEHLLVKIAFADLHKRSSCLQLVITDICVIVKLWK